VVLTQCSASCWHAGPLVACKTQAALPQWSEASGSHLSTDHTLHAGLQILNPAETFGDIIVDYSYVECSSACITALAAFAAKYVGEHCPRSPPLLFYMSSCPVA
jgi:hypothetical protein